ncbi:DUF6318 family protein [Arthrobacter sp. zg-Y1143]|uniref:DUF6318 family protein n=1 Tax=Arthrobacter sp. zg-Y1143 TaxID=3049065 RepID=UPI0024C2B929|nr:DUF6318 family protein [Arthrobacter sp. zg-Y1143]MDK1328390.1 DUF6318 family protein [Arthrobacter sp. zg-Y1143]
MTRTILRRSRVWSFPAVFAAVVLAGCSGASGDSGTGAASPSPSQSSASTTPTPTPTPSAVYKPASAEGPAENVPLPVMPEEAKVESKEGLEAFARYWYEAANYGYETGDVGLVQAISSPDCVTCQKYYEVVENGFKDSDWMANAAIEVLGVHSDFLLTPEGRYQALVHFRQDKMEYYGPEGLQTVGEPDAAVVQLVEAIRLNEHWQVVNIATIKG